MKKIKKILTILTLCLSVLLIASCSEEDEGKLPNISFKKGGVYTSANTNFTAGTPLTIGINASKAESADVLKKFNISKSVDGGTKTTLFDKDLTGEEGNTFVYDFTTNSEASSGKKSLYTFTVTNRDGLINQVSLTVTTN